MRPRPHVLVMAKAPRPGHVKTRLCPPLSAQQAAEVAEAALRDTLAAVSGTHAARRIVALDGPVGEWLPPGFDVIEQCRGPFDTRLSHAWALAGGPGVQIGMDTPQVTADLLDEALDALTRPSVDSVLGAAHDGGWWIIGLRRPDPAVFDGVPMSAPNTGACQYRRLASLGLSVHRLPVLRDIDTIGDAVHHAERHPHTRTASVVRACVGLTPTA